MSRPVAIRNADASDFDAWLELFAAVAAEGKWVGAEAPDFVSRGWPERMVQELLASQTSSLFLAESGGLLLGTLHVEDQRGCVELGMFVRGAHRGQGVGSALMDACLEWARQRQAHKVTLDVWPHNEAAIALYRKYGFAIEGRLVRHWRRRTGELWDLIRMGLVLDTTSPGSPYADTLG